MVKSSSNHHLREYVLLFRSIKQANPIVLVLIFGDRDRDQGLLVPKNVKQKSSWWRAICMLAGGNSHPNFPPENESIRMGKSPFLIRDTETIHRLMWFGKNSIQSNLRKFRGCFSYQTSGFSKGRARHQSGWNHPTPKSVAIYRY